MNIRNCPLQVIRSCILLNFKFDHCLFFTERTIKIGSGDFKSRIDSCQKDSASLKHSLHTRVNLDTNIQVKGIGRMVKAMIDDKLGAVELHSSIN